MLGGNAAADALIDGGGVEEAVADDDAALREGGADDFFCELGAAGAEEEDFGGGADAHFGAGEFEDVADGFTQGGAAGFAGDEVGDAVLFEAFDEVVDLGGFARAFAAFEGDEFWGHARGGLMRLLVEARCRLQTGVTAAGVGPAV